MIIKIKILGGLNKMDKIEISKKELLEIYKQFLVLSECFCDDESIKKEIKNIGNFGIFTIEKLKYRVLTDFRDRCDVVCQKQYQKHYKEI